MKVILLKNIKNLGEKYKVADLKPGYVRNYLIPQGLVEIATVINLERIKAIKDKEKNEIAKKFKKEKKLALRMKGLKLKILAKTGEKNELFEKIGAQKISEELKKLGFSIEKNQVEISEEIKKTGKFEAKIKFERGIEPNIKIIVQKENQKKK